MRPGASLGLGGCQGVQGGGGPHPQRLRRLQGWELLTEKVDSKKLLLSVG